MKVVIATAVYHPMINGVAVFSHNLAVGLAKRGHQVMVICPSQTGESYAKTIDGVKTVFLKSVDVKIYPDQIHAVPEKKKFLGLKWPRLFYKNGFKVSVFPAREVKEVLDKFKPDVVHVQISDPIGLSVVSYARKQGIPVVTTEHNQPEVLTEPMHMPKVVQKPVNALLYDYFYHCQNKSDFVTMPTKQAIDNLIYEKGKEFKVPVAAVSNGVDLSNFKPGEPAKEIYKKYNLDERLPTVLYIGRVDPEKKVGLVVEAFCMAEENGLKAQLMIVGDGVDRIGLADDLKGHKNIHFLGRVLPPDLYELYKVGDVFVTASEIETQGIVLIEAAASGLPLVAVDKGAVAEVCKDGENGYLCQPKNVKEISAAIVKILSNRELQEKFSKASVKIASEHDFEKTLDKFINIYTHLVEK